MCEDWDWRCASMVETLLREPEAGPKLEMPGPHLLETMVQTCMKRLGEERDGSMRKSDLGGFLKSKFGSLYQRGWLKHVIAAMEDKQLVCSTPWDVSLTGVHSVVAKTGARWCHFYDQCKYMRDMAGNQAHFENFVHLCPFDVRCPYVTEHLLGRPATPAALRHFSRWKHRCPQRQFCVHHANAHLYPEHSIVFTHKAGVYAEHDPVSPRADNVFGC